MTSPALLSAAVLLLLSGIPASNSNQTPITILVSNSVTSSENQTYNTHVVFRGILLGGLRRLRDSNTGFNFTYTENADYGPFLESVNGLAGNFSESTYWELLVQKPSGQTIRTDVGIGCYIPEANDTINLNFNRFNSTLHGGGCMFLLSPPLSLLLALFVLSCLQLS